MNLLNFIKLVYSFKIFFFNSKMNTNVDERKSMRDKQRGKKNRVFFNFIFIENLINNKKRNKILK
jgi:hypothetical protein